MPTQLATIRRPTVRCATAREKLREAHENLANGGAAAYEVVIEDAEDQEQQADNEAEVEMASDDEVYL